MSRIIAQVVVAGATVLFRAATQAFQQALINAQKSGVAAEAVKTTTQKAGTMAVNEARLILGLKDDAAWSEVMKRYKHLYDMNEKHGSFYLLSKVYRAREAIEEEYKAQGLVTPEELDESKKVMQDGKQEQQQQGQQK